MQGNDSVLWRLSPFAFLAALVLVFFRPALLDGETFFAFNNLGYFFPWVDLAPDSPPNALLTDPIHGLVFPVMHLIKTSLEQGAVPLWNPFNFSGLLFLTQSNPLEYLALLWLPVTTAHDVLLASYQIAAGVLTYLYLREIGLRLLPALTGAVAWMFNGHVMVWFEFEYAPLMAATLSGTLFFIERWLRTRSAPAFLGLVIALAFALCADFVQILVYQWLLVGVYVLYRSFGADFRRASVRQILGRRIPLLGLAFLAAIVVGANSLTVGLTAMEGSQREPHSFATLHRNTGVLPPEYLRTAIFPGFYGTPGWVGTFPPKPGPGYPYNNYNELCFYSGVAPLFLAAICLCAPRRRYVPFFLGTAGLSLWIAAGSILYYPIPTLLPPLGLTTPTRILFLFGFSVSVLSAIGLQILTEKRRVRPWLAAGISTLLAGTALAIALEVQSPAGIARVVRNSFEPAGLDKLSSTLEFHFSLGSPAMLEPLLLSGAVFVLLLATIRFGGSRFNGGLAAAFLALTTLDLVGYATRHNTTVSTDLAYPSTEGIRFLQRDPTLFRVAAFGGFLSNGFLPFGIQDVGGYSSFYSERYAELCFLSQFGPDAPLPEEFAHEVKLERLGFPILDLLNTKYVLVPPGTRLALPNLELVYNGEIRIHRNQTALPRAFVVPGYRLVPERQAAYRVMGRTSHEQLLRRVLLESPPPLEYRDLSSSRIPSNASVEVTSYSPNRLEMEVRSDARGFLVVGDAYHPGWQARVNGEDREVLLANYALRAIPIDAGASTVTLRFRPQPMVAGVVVTAVSWLVLAGAGIVLLARRALARR